MISLIYRHCFSLSDDGKGLELRPGLNEFNLKTVAGSQVGCFFVNQLSVQVRALKFMYSEKDTKFCKIFTLILSCVVSVKSKVKISQNFVTFSEYVNFKIL